MYKCKCVLSYVYNMECFDLIGISQLQHQKQYYSLLVDGILDYQCVPKGWKLSYPQFLHPGKATTELGLATL